MDCLLNAIFWAESNLQLLHPWDHLEHWLMCPLVHHLVVDHLEKDHLVEVLNFLMRSVIAPIDSQGPLSEESVLVFSMALHMGSSLAHCLVQIPLSLESFLLSNHGLILLLDQNHTP